MKANVAQAPWASDRAEDTAERAVTGQTSARQEALDDCIATVLATLPAREGHTCCQGMRHAILDALTKLRNESRGSR